MAAHRTADPGFGPNALAVPSELVLLVRVALPLDSHRQRQAALGFAVEDLIAESLEVSHVALGRELAPGEYLAAVVRHAAMADWAKRTAAARPRLVPDVLSLPIPTEGSTAVREEDRRILVRRADGTGYATNAAAFEALWRADGAPQVVLYGGTPPDTVPVAATGLMPASTPDALGFDLRQVAYARDSARWPRTIARIAAVAAFTLVAHGALLGADTLALQRLATQREADLRSALATRLPDLPPWAPLDVALRRAIPTTTAVDDSAFLPLLARTSGALQADESGISLSTLAFDSTERSLALTIQAPDLATLQRVETSLGATGLAVASGAATTGDGTAEVRLTIQAGGA